MYGKKAQKFYRRVAVYLGMVLVVLILANLLIALILGNLSRSVESLTDESFRTLEILNATKVEVMGAFDIPKLLMQGDEDSAVSAVADNFEASIERIEHGTTFPDVDKIKLITKLREVDATLRGAIQTGLSPNIRVSEAGGDLLELQRRIIDFNRDTPSHMTAISALGRMVAAMNGLITTGNKTRLLDYSVALSDFKNSGGSVYSEVMPEFSRASLKGLSAMEAFNSRQQAWGAINVQLAEIGMLIQMVEARFRESSFVQQREAIKSEFTVLYKSLAFFVVVLVLVMLGSYLNLRYITRDRRILRKENTVRIVYKDLSHGRS